MNTGYLLMNVSRQLRYELNQALEEKGVTIQQWAIIQQIAMFSPKKRVTAAFLSQKLGLDKPTLSGIIKRLELKKFIRKEDHPEDSRSKLLFLTPLGLQKMHVYQKISDHLLAEYLSPLSMNEQQQLNGLLTQINKKKFQSAET